MRIAIASPLEAKFVDKIRAIDRANIVEYFPELLPPPRYPSDHRGEPDWRRDAAGEKRWADMLGKAEVMFGTPGDTGSTLAAAIVLAQNLRLVAATAAGAGELVRGAALDPDALERIAFTSAAGVHGGMLAEFAFAGLLALRKDFRRLERIRKARSWDHYASGELAGSTVAIVGLGGIGRAVARRARAFDMTVLAITRSGASDALADESYALTELRTAFALADAIVCTLPATDHTARVIDARAIDAMRPDAIFCNVGRGSVVDQAALTNALRAGRIAGAVLDVVEPEPLPPDDPLWTLENVVFAPHTMALSIRENERIVDLFCDNLRRFAEGRELRNRIDVREFY